MDTPRFNYELGKLNDQVVMGNKPPGMVRGHLETLRGEVESFEEKVREEAKSSYQSEAEDEFANVKHALGNLETRLEDATFETGDREAAINLGFVRYKLRELSERYDEA